MAHSHKTQIRVGADYNYCPCCKASYLNPDHHHIACPVGMSDSLCHYCGHAEEHETGCPRATGLYPILIREASASLECASCSTVFELGDCFVIGVSAIVCVGCGWLEAAGR